MSYLNFLKYNNKDNNKTYSIIAFDNNLNLYLLKDDEDTTYKYILAKNIDENGWDRAEYFDNFESAYAEFSKTIFSNISYKEQIKYIVKDLEGVEFGDVDFDIFYDKYMDDDSESGIINREYVDNIINEINKDVLSAIDEIDNEIVSFNQSELNIVEGIEDIENEDELVEN